MALKVFSQKEAATLAAWCDVIAPGASEASVASFVDANLAKPETECLLLIRYLVNPPFEDFYRSGIAGIDTESQARFSRSFLELDADEQKAIVEAAVSSKTKAWKNPDPNFFYYISRSDAVDMVYGTPEGFARLGIAYDAHIEPARPW